MCRFRREAALSLFVQSGKGGCENVIVADCRQQSWIDAPVEVVWALIRDVNRHPEWWPRVVEVECEGLEEGCTYRQVTETPFGYQELDVVIDRLEELRELKIRCTNTGTFVDLAVTPAETGTFVDARFGMDPLSTRMRLFDAIAGKRYFRRWLEQSLEAMQEVAHQQAGSRG
jgi:Polyketide cyclase / dehydrase and lipid transport